MPLNSGTLSNPVAIHFSRNACHDVSVKEQGDCRNQLPAPRRKGSQAHVPTLWRKTLPASQGVALPIIHQWQEIMVTVVTSGLDVNVNSLVHWWPHYYDSHVSCGYSPCYTATSGFRICLVLQPVSISTLPATYFSSPPYFWSSAAPSPQKRNMCLTHFGSFSRSRKDPTSWSATKE